MATAVASAIKAVCKGSKDASHPRIALLTPYITSIHNKNVAFLQENGIDVVTQHNLGFKSDKETSAMTPESIFEYGKCLANLNTDVDALFIGCGGMRSTGIIHSTDRSISLPVYFISVNICIISENNHRIHLFYRVWLYRSIGKGYRQARYYQQSSINVAMSQNVRQHYTRQFVIYCRIRTAVF